MRRMCLGKVVTIPLGRECVSGGNQRERRGFPKWNRMNEISRVIGIVSGEEECTRYRNFSGIREDVLIPGEEWEKIRGARRISNL